MRKIYFQITDPGRKLVTRKNGRLTDPELGSALQGSCVKTIKLLSLDFNYFQSYFTFGGLS